MSFPRGQKAGSTYDVEAVDVTLVDPALHFVCDFFGCAYGCCAETADCRIV